jgi:nitrite reductase (NADH) large subunit
MGVERLKMRVVIIGNGMAGTLAAKTLRELNAGAEVEVFAEEKYPYYPRPNLIEFLAGNMPLERIFAFPGDWAISQRINVHLQTFITRIFPATQEVEVSDGRKEKYDALLLATGAQAFIPPIRGADKAGVFALRTLDDAFHILDYLEKHRRVAVIGGGLLGLETARAIRARGSEVEVVEFFDRLLPRQLDPQGAFLLKTQLENMGIRIRLGAATDEILGQGSVSGLRFKDGRETAAEMAIVAAGVRPNLGIVKDAGLQTDKGLVVDDHLRTSQAMIYGAGDNVQHRGKLYGIIPASFDQARIAAANMLGQDKTYEGTVVSNTLKVVGLYVTSVGVVNPEGGDYVVVRREKPEEGIYKKLVIQNGILVGSIWMGTKRGVNGITRAVLQKINVEKWKDSLLEEDFDFSLL